MLILSPSTGAQPHDGTPATTDGKPLVHHQHRARVILQHAYSLERWRDPTPVRAAEKRAWQRHRLAILIPKVRFSISFYRERLSDRFDRYRAKQLAVQSHCIPGVTVYSIDGVCIAIPAYIVACETRGFYGENRWTALNPSGAAGIYQIMPEHGRPWPVDSVADKRAHHRIAAQLYGGGSGASNWVCA